MQKPLDKMSIHELREELQQTTKDHMNCKHPSILPSINRYSDKILEAIKKAEKN